ncbi:hypothetical protein VTK26DRAFT_4772 [Humicola hyalothermophila]
MMRVAKVRIKLMYVSISCIVPCLLLHLPSSLTSLISLACAGPDSGTDPHTLARRPIGRTRHATVKFQSLRHHQLYGSSCSAVGRHARTGNCSRVENRASDPVLRRHVQTATFSRFLITALSSPALFVLSLGHIHNLPKMAVALMTQLYFALGISWSGASSWRHHHIHGWYSTSSSLLLTI